MHFARGNWGHLKAKWDNHPSCIPCSLRSRSSPCFICNQWTDDIWKRAKKRRLHSKRRSVMTQRRKQKKAKRIMSDPTDATSLDGSTAPNGCTARGRTHQGGSPLDNESIQALSTSHRSTRHQSTSHWSTSHRLSSHRSTSHTSHLSTSHRSTSQPGTGQPVTSHRSFTLDYQSPVIMSPVSHRSLYLSILILRP